MFPEQAFKSIITARTHFARYLRVGKSLNKPSVLLPLALLIFAVLGCRVFQSSPHKTDAQLTAEFQRNKEKFSRLVAMIKEDKKYISEDRLKAGKIEGISQSRFEEYKKLVESLNLLRISLDVDEQSPVPLSRIYFMSTAYVRKGEFDCKYTEDKGFVWYETGRQPAQREVRNLDREYFKGEDVKAESRIDDNWSLYYEYETCFHD